MSSLYLGLPKLKMKLKSNHLLAIAAAAMVIGFCSSTSAQAQGNFDPAQFRQRQLDNYRERLDVKSDEDWKKIETLITKVMDAQRDSRMGMGFGGRGNRRGGGGGADQGGNTNRNRFGGTPVPEAEALSKAIDDKAANDEIKTKLAQFREARKAKEATLAKAQDDLRKALTPRQEAGAVLEGLLK
ncbi:MAG: hypothetical protein JWM16_617 [Verrucomicrobiales bacterium]|nr:hypothetical protein [Verrucomicrobiales bacterium]